MTLDGLEKLGDEELQGVIGRVQGILRERDMKRKDNAREEARAKLEEARAILLRAGLAPTELTARRKPQRSRSASANGKTLVYKGGHQYQHPARKDLIWNAKGKKPGWLTALEAEGGKAVEVGNG
jgi:DNA-binding protein H-NS